MLKKYHFSLLFLTFFITSIILPARSAVSSLSGNEDNPLKKIILDNGLTVVVKNLPNSSLVSCQYWVKTGSAYEDNYLGSGISHFIEHMIFKGTRKRSSFEIAKELDAIGGLSNAFTGKEYTCFHSKVMDKHFRVLGDILSDIFLNSDFDPANLNRERQVILQEISMVEDSPEEHIHELFNNLFWNNHPLGMSILGTAETVAAIDREIMLEHLRRHYTPGRIIIAVTGNVDHDEVVDFFKPLFKSLDQDDASSPVNEPHINSGILCSYKNLEQVHICLGGKAPHLSSKRRFAGAILNTILGGNMSSRLFQEVREKRGLAYAIYSFLSSYLETGLLGICVATDSEEVNNVLDVINKEIVKIQNGDISENDLNEAREHLVGGIILGSESTDTRMMRLAKNEYVFGRYIEYEELIEDLERVTIDEVVACLREAFLPGNISLAMLGPFKKEALDLKDTLFETACES